MTEFSKHLVIEAPNSSGQGYCPNHASNPLHAVLSEFGWEYSHTTPIRWEHGSETYGHHTYRFPGTDWVIGVDCRRGWASSASRLGSGRLTCFSLWELRPYLQRKTAKLKAIAASK